jgi:hypothetical protein
MLVGERLFESNLIIIFLTNNRTITKNIRCFYGIFMVSIFTSFFAEKRKIEDML